MDVQAVACGFASGHIWVTYRLLNVIASDPLPPLQWMCIACGEVWELDGSSAALMPPEDARCTLSSAEARVLNEVFFGVAGTPS